MKQEDKELKRKQDAMEMVGMEREVIRKEGMEREVVQT